MKTEVKHQALPVGRILRIAMGAFFLYEVHDVYLTIDINGISIRVAWAIALVLFYSLLHYVVRNHARNFNPILGALLAWAPVVVVYILGYGGPAATGALTFLGLTLVLAGIRGDSGCEVMSFPALFTGKHTHFYCLMFSPLDWLERKLSGSN